MQYVLLVPMVGLQPLLQVGRIVDQRLNPATIRRLDSYKIIPIFHPQPFVTIKDRLRGCIDPVEHRKNQIARIIGS